MLMQPQLSRLQQRVAESLEKTVLDGDMTAPYARQQVKAAAFAMRDLAFRAAHQDPLARAGIAAMQALLTRYADVVPDPGPTERSRVEPDPVSLHQDLQARIENLETRLAAGLEGPAAERCDTGLRELRKMYQRMLDRERDARKRSDA